MPEHCRLECVPFPARRQQDFRRFPVSVHEVEGNVHEALQPLHQVATCVNKDVPTYVLIGNIIGLRMTLLERRCGGT